MADDITDIVVQETVAYYIDVTVDRPALIEIVAPPIHMVEVEELGGPIGPQGPQGPLGPAGAQGTPGIGIVMKGSVLTYAYLPTTPLPNDGWLTQDTEHVWVWNGTEWVDCGVITGPTGDMGPAGPQGLQGPEGPQGATGYPGSDGAPGSTGLQGEPGMTGPQGPVGPVGSQGPSGLGINFKGQKANSAALPPTGNTVNDGWVMVDTGHTWVWTGTAWVDVGIISGPQGAQGIQGLQGVDGPQGPAGTQGIKGDTGDTGPIGPQGIQGPQGVQGVQGDTGLQGPQGPAGATETGASILAKLAPVDGAASGLDADKVDGLDSLYLLDRTNHTGFQAISTVGGLQAALDLKAPLASPALTGTPTAPTAATADSTTTIATTAFVKAQAYSTLASPTFTGDPKAPTPATADNDTSIATTAHVQANMALKANVSHTHAQADVTNLVADLALKSPLASPTFTGTPAAPTAAALTSTTQLATTAFVTAADTALGALKANVSHTHAQADITSLVSDLALKAPLASPALTGTPTAPTPTAGDNDTSIATTAFVTGGIATSAATKEPTIAAGTAAQYWQGTKTWQTLDKAAVGLANVDNTTDLLKPISTATQTALNTKEPTLAIGTTAQYYRGDKSWQTHDKASVGLGSVDNTADTAKPVSTAQQTALNLKANIASPTFTGKATVAASATGSAGFNVPHGVAPSAPADGDVWTTTLGVYVRANGVTQGPLGAGGEPSIAMGTTAQYWRGDKSWQTLDKTAVGLANVDNTTDAAKPVSTATQTALNLKANLAGPTFTGVPAAPTASAGTNTTQIATTAFVSTAMSGAGLGDMLKSVYDTDGDGKVNSAGTADAAPWAGITGKPATFPPTLPITQADVTSLVADLALKSPLASPTFTGVPAAPTAAQATNTTQLATTAFVQTNMALKANATHTHAQADVTNLVSDLALKAPLADPTFTGTPDAPTATAGTSTTQIATTAFVTTADALKANIASPTFTGIPAAPTAAALTSTTQIATTQFVTSALANYQLESEKGANDGYASLDSVGKVPMAQLPAAVVGSVIYQGTWNAATNTPTIPSAVGTKGHYYLVAVAGNTLINGISDWAVNDWIISSGTTWDKVDNTDQVTSVAGRQGAVTLAIADISGGAPLASPTFTGVPAAPTAAALTNTTQLATTAFVTAADTALGALKANVSHTHAQADVTNLVTDLGLKAPLASPTFTGTPAAPTAAALTNTTQLATTAFVTAADTALGALKANVSHTHAQADVTNLVADLALKSPLASPAFTGIPTAPTAATTDNDTQLATTAFVQANIALTQPLIALGTTAQYWRGDKSWQTLDKTAVGLANVDNTTDAAKPVSTATQTALNLKANIANPTFTGKVVTELGTTALASIMLPHGVAPSAPVNGDMWTTTVGLYARINGQTVGPYGGSGSFEPIIAVGTTAQYWRGDKSWVALDKAAVGLANVDNTSDANKPVSTATSTALSGKESTIAIGTTAQYWRGDKSWQTHDKASVGLGSVDNTADTAKPVSTAQQTALNLKADLAGPTFTGVPAAPTAAQATNTTQLATTAFVQTNMALKANATHTHAQADVTNLVTDLGLKAPLADPVFTGTPDAPTAAPGTNTTQLATTAFVTAADTALGALKANVSHTHAQADVTNLVTDLGLKAPLASPALTGTPTAPTALTADNDTQIATTAFVQANMALKANATHTHAQADVTNLVADLALKSPLASPTFTGVPAAPTAAALTNTTQLATTAFVTTADALKANLASPTFTGVPAAPTPATGDDSTTLATTAFVKAQGYTSISPNNIALTGIPTAPTAPASTNTPQIATTAFVQANMALKANINHSHSLAALGGEPTIALGTTAQYWRGDKSWQTLDKAAVGLASVDDTSDAAKPVSTAQQTALNLKANLASPALTGTPTAPTAATADSSTTIATTAFVKAQAYAPLADPTFTGTPDAPTAAALTNTTQIATTAFVTAADTALGALKANVSHTHAQADVTNLVADLALKSPLASPTFTGTPAAPTAAALTNTTQLATTAFVTTADNLKANLASPTFTGVPAAPTATPGTNTTQLATTAFSVAGDALQVTKAGDTMTGKLTTLASAAGTAGLTLPHGAAPTSPVNGDLWTTTAGLYARVNAVTIGPIGAAGEPTIPLGTTAQYWRGDKSWQSFTAAVAAESINWSQIINEPTTYPPTLPITQSDVTNLTSDLAAKVTDAASDSKFYVRRNAVWEDLFKFLSPMNARQFEWRTEIVAPPTTGQLRLNNATVASATTMWLFKTDMSALSTALVFPEMIVVGARLAIVDQDDPTAWHIFRVTSALVDSTTYWTVPIALEGTGGVAITNASRSMLHILPADSSLYAPLASPTFTGVPAAPTAAAATNTTQIATTAFVTTADNLKANLASPTFTGVPAAPTAAALTNTTQLATTAFVATSFAPLASPALTGTPTAPTAAALTNTTQIATTAFVTAADNLKAPNANPTFSGKVSIPPSLTTGAGLNIQQGTAPTTPTNGDFWTVSTGVYVHLNSVTQQLAPLASPTFTGTVNAAAITATGNITANTHFISSAASVVLAATGSGQVYFRPNGAAVSTGETTISTAGTMTVTGNLVIQPAAGNASFYLIKPAAALGSDIWGQNAGKNRWLMRLGNTVAESGSNAGSDFTISRYDDAGTTSLGTALSISRATGVLTTENSIYAVGNIQSTSGAFGSGTAPLYLRPNGIASATGQTIIDSGGNMAIAGAVTATSYFTSSSTNIVLSSTGSGNVYLRPNGSGSSAGEFRVDYSGNALVSNLFYGGVGYMPRSGIAGGYPAGNPWNFWWASPALQAYVDSSNLGNILNTSDYRIKKDVADLPSTWEQVKALRPISYTHQDFEPVKSAETKAALLQRAIEDYAATQSIPVNEVDPKDMPSKPVPPPLFTNDDTPQWGFIAHEVQDTLLPSAASGEKDMEDGVQSLNLASILAATVRGLQEAMTRIETLEIVTLEKAA